MTFLKSLVSKKLAVTAAAIALVQSLPMTADWKGICTAALALAFVLAQAYVDAQPSTPVQDPPPAPEAAPKPPILPLFALCLLVLTGCADAKPIVRTVNNDIAPAICAAFFSQKQGISLEQAAELFCKTQQQLQPWINHVLALEKSGIPSGTEQNPVYVKCTTEH